MQVIGLTLLFGFGGFIAAVFYTFVIGFAGTPGALLSIAAAKRSSEGVTPIWGLLLTVAGQLYASMFFVALVIHFVEARLNSATGFGKWTVWIIAFSVAVAPPAFALRDAARAERRNVQHEAIVFTAPLTALAFFYLSSFRQL